MTLVFIFGPNLKFCSLDLDLDQAEQYIFILHSAFCLGGWGARGFLVNVQGVSKKAQ